MSSYKTKAIVLKSYNLGEADKILKLFSKDNGLIDAVAKGARKIKSRFGGRLEIFNFVELELSRGRNLDIINQAELLKNFSDIPNDFNKFLLSQFMCQIVLKTHFSETEVTPAIFKLLYVCLNAINSTTGIEKGSINSSTDDKNNINSTDINSAGWDGAHTIKKITVFFIAKFLKITGYPPLISVCSVCGKDIVTAYAPVFPDAPLQGTLNAYPDDNNKKLKAESEGKTVFVKNNFYFSIRLGGALCKECEPKIQNIPDIKKILGHDSYNFLNVLFNLKMKACMESEIKNFELDEVFKLLEEYLKYHYDLNITTGTCLKNILEL